MKSSEAFSRVFNETAIRALGFCDTKELNLVPKELYSIKSSPDSILDLPTTFEAFNWKVYNLNMGERDYNELLIRFYS